MKTDTPKPTLAALRAAHAAWSQRQFGDVSAVGPAKHLSKEALEVAAAPHDPIEHADCWMLLWDMQRRAGISDDMLAAAIQQKLAVNIARSWPAPQEGEAREHLRAGGMKTIDQLLAGQTAWYSSNDEEVWAGGPYDSREEAETEAKAREHRLIMQATKAPICVSDYFDQEAFFEAAEESLYDQCNEDGDSLLDFTPAVNLDLQARVRKAIDEWQVAHQLSPQPWRFSWSDDADVAAWVKEAEGGAE